ncbi:MAG: hypothetical protein NZ521_08750, partial [Flammeovirgaceae bacterium]|nr:hypothetical protein [Flammeovirgaceae bacterium]MDW8288305.1 hypothetical protein [Flammeovirgaceae bacterium]
MRRNLLIFYMMVFYATSIFAQPLSYWQSIPDSLYVKGEIIVKLNENSASNQRTSGNPLDVLSPIKTKQVKPLFDLNDARSRTTNHANPHVQEKQRKYGLANMYRISLANVEETASVLDYLNRQEEVVYAEPVYRNFPLYMPNDPHFSGQYNLTVAQVPAAWDITEGSSDVVIGIVDNEFIVSHEDLVNKWYYNNAELYGTPGVDDDMNGYVDDYCGYDFHGR